MERYCEEQRKKYDLYGDAEEYTDAFRVSRKAGSFSSFFSKTGRQKAPRMLKF